MIQIADVFALSTSDEERYENDVSEHPAEKGSNFVDNTVAKSETLSRDCTISATPLGENLNAAFGPDIVKGCRARLRAIRNTREPITVRDSTGVYVNMLITSLVFTRTIKTGDALVFKIGFKSLEVIENERSVVKVAIPRVQAKINKGPKVSAKPDPPPPAKDVDPLRNVSNFISRGVSGSNVVHE